MGLNKTPVSVRVTNYSVKNNALVEIVSYTEFEASIKLGYGGRFWLYIAGGPASMPWDKVPEAIERGGWTAQSGTPPVFVKPCMAGPRPCGPGCGCGPGDDVGGWGGRNYPEWFVESTELDRIHEKLSNIFNI